MQNKKHLPIYGIGPLLCFPLLAVASILFILSITGIIPVTDFGSCINVILFAVGIIFIVVGVALFFGADAGGNLQDNIKENRLKTNGSYRFVRNPCYSTFLLLEIGLVCMCHNIYLLIIPFLFWIEMTIVLKRTEEKWLEELYGQEYLEYCKRVNRCFPWFKRKKCFNVCEK